TTFTLENALLEKLVSLQDIADGISFKTLADHLPPDQLRHVVRHALEGGRSGKPLTEASLLEVVPLRALVGYVPQHIIWQGAILARIPRPVGLVGENQPAKSSPSDQPPREEEPQAAPKPRAVKKPASAPPEVDSVPRSGESEPPNQPSPPPKAPREE